MKSMTGFGRQDFQDSETEISVEIKTVNHRFCDFFIKLPRTLNPLEEKVRRTINQYIARGRIEVYIRYNETGIGSRKIILNNELAKEYVNVLHEIQRMDPIIDQTIDVGLIARFPDVIIVEEETKDMENIWSKLCPVLESALKQVDEGRTVEGSHLKKDIVERCSTIEAKTAVIAEKAPDMVRTHQDNLRRKIAEYTQSAEIDEQRLLTEVAVLSDKLAIDEELTRLASHTQRMRELVAIENEPVGRKLDFIVQEMNREINTIGSKSTDLAIANQVVDIKSEIEKIREQVQNIE